MSGGILHHVIRWNVVFPTPPFELATAIIISTLPYFYTLKNLKI